MSRSDRDEIRRLRSELREQQLKHHLQNLEIALALAENDELFREILRPHFKAIMQALDKVEEIYDPPA